MKISSFFELLLKNTFKKLEIYQKLFFIVAQNLAVKKVAVKPIQWSSCFKHLMKFKKMQTL